MDRPARSARVSFGPLVLVSTLLAVVLAVAARETGSRDGQVGSGPSSTAAAVLAARPAITGSARPPLAESGQLALERLAATSRIVDGPGHEHSGAGHQLFGPTTEEPLSPVDADRFATQWEAARAAVPALDSAPEAAAAGYVLSSTPSPGVGVHWVKWELIAQPFDPARPSMLLFAADRDGGDLVGFSYWVHSPSPPEGFAGPNDRWHTHSGLCVVNGWVEREAVGTPAECPGSWLAGDDLWMLHAWVVDGYVNRWGRFAPTNPKLCPRGGPDLLSCTPDQG